MTVTARPSFAMSNTSGHGSPCNPDIHICDPLIDPTGTETTPQAPSGFGIDTDNNTGSTQAPSDLQIR